MALEDALRKELLAAAMALPGVVNGQNVLNALWALAKLFSGCR